MVESLESRWLLHGVFSVSPLNGESNVSTSSDIVAVFDFDAVPATVNTSSFELRDPQGQLIPATVSYDGPSRTATLSPISPLPDIADYYKATLVGGSAGIKEAGTNEPIEQDFVWHFITETPNYSDTVIFSGLTNPTAVEFASDGRVFVAEKSGLIKVFDSLTDTTADLFADLRTNVHNHWDRGLLGMALHPNFPSIPELYVLYTYDAPLRDTSLPPGSQDLPPAPYWGTPGVSGDPGPGTTGDGPSVSARLSRLTVGADNTWDNVEHVLVHDWGQQYPSHSIGDLVFGSDGALYASAGDGASFNFPDYGQNNGRLGNTALDDPPNQGGALRTQDLRSRDLGVPIPDDPVGLDGSIIRVDPSVINGGAPLPDNPLFGDADSNAARIVAYGQRNPFRITVKPGTNEIWSGDVGWTKWEEINVIRDPVDSLIENFGWPAYEGSNPQSGYDGLNLPLLENLYADPDPNAHIEPFFAYEHGEPVFPGGPQPSGNSSSISGLAFSEGGNLPPAYDHALFISDFSRTGIWVMFPGINGDPDPASGIPVLLNASNPVQLKIDPAGDLYYVDVGGSIRRVRFEGVDVPPTAVAQANPTSGPLNPDLVVNFDGTASSDANPEDTLTYRWDLDGDGQLDDSTSAQPNFAYTVPGVVTVTLEVTDSTGLKDTDTIDISVGNTAPTAVIDSPSAALTWKVGDTINFSGHADDIDEAGGVLPPSALDWEINLLHCPDNQCHTHFVTSFSGTSGGSFVAPDHEYPSQLEIILTATDPVTSLQDTETLLLTPQTVDLTFQSNPPGLDLTVNGEADTTPFNFTVIAGSDNLINAPSPQSVGQTSYVFDSWSDGGAQSHRITAGQSQTFTATYDGSVTPFDTTDAGTGTITAQGENNGVSEGKEQAFDNASGTKWLDFANANPSTRASWIQYQYASGDKYVVSSYTITSANDAPERDPRDWSLLGSNDEVNFTVLDTRTGEDFPSRFQTRTFSFSNSTGYNFYRLDIASVADPPSANSVQLAEIELIGVPDGSPILPTVSIQASLPNAAEGTPPTAGQFTVSRTGSTNGPLTVNYTIAGSAVTADYVEPLSGSVIIPDGAASTSLTITPVDDTISESAETVELTLAADSTYTVGAPNTALVTIADNDSPPPIGSDTTDAGTGTITAQGENNGVSEGKEQAFDNASGTKWLDFADANPSTRASWIQYQYASGDKYVVSSYTITSANDAPERDPRDWSLLASDDGVNFTVLDTRTGEDFPSRFQTRTFSFSNSTGYNFYRLDIASVADPASANSLQLAEIELIGVPEVNNPPLAADDFVAVAENNTVSGSVLLANPASWIWTIPVIDENQVNNSTANPPGDGTTDSPATGSATVEIKRNPGFIVGDTTSPDEEYLISVGLNWNGLVGDLTKVHIHGWLTPGGQPVGPNNSTPTHLYEIPGLETESAVIASGVNRRSDSYSVTDQFLRHTHPFDDPTLQISPEQIIDEFTAGRAYFNVHSTAHLMGEIRGNLPALQLVDQDPDGDTITVSEVNGNPFVVGTEIPLASGALLFMNPDGNFNYNPNGQFNSLAAGEQATDTFEYTIDDGKDGSSVATVIITIYGVNEPPAPAQLDAVMLSNLMVNSDAQFGSDTEPVPTYSVFDVNRDSRITTLDALSVINHVSRITSSEDESIDEASIASRRYVDVNGDGTVSALDALQVINYLNRQSNTESLNEGESIVPQRLPAATNLASSQPASDLFFAELGKKEPIADAAMITQRDQDSVAVGDGSSEGDRSHDIDELRLLADEQTLEKIRGIEGETD